MATSLTAKKLYMRRTRAGMTQDQLAKRLRVVQPDVSHFERMEFEEIPFEKVQKLSRWANQLRNARFRDKIEEANWIAHSRGLRQTDIADRLGVAPYVVCLVLRRRAKGRVGAPLAARVLSAVLDPS